MAKGQAGRRRAPVKRSRGGAGRMVLAFVAGVAVAGAGLWWLQRAVMEPGSRAQRWTAGVLGMPRAAAGPGGTGKAAEEAAPESQGRRTPAPEVAARGPAPVGAASENGARGVPGEPVRAGGGTPPFGESEEVFEAGARVYGAQCASCHGRPGRSATAEKGEMAAGQFWTANGSRAVARQPVGQIFQAIAEGQPERQMPAYKRVLSESQMWDLALLLRNAGGELPDPVVTILRTGR